MGLANAQTSSDTTIYHWGKSKITVTTEKGSNDIKTLRVTSDLKRKKAQQKVYSVDTTITYRINPHAAESKAIHKYYRHSKKVHTHWGGLDLGVNGYLNTEGGTRPSNPAMMLNYSNSRYFAINFLKFDGRLIGNNLFFVTGLGINWYSYRFSNNYTLNAHSASFSATENNNLDYCKNKLGITYLTAPLLLEVHMGEKNKVHLAVGASLSYKIDAWVKQKYEDANGEDHKTKVKDNFNLSPFNVNGMLRVGYGDFTLFGNYSFTQLFEKGSSGPELYPFSVGVRLVGW